MTFDLGLAFNIFNLDLVTGSNYIYPVYIIAIIIKKY